MSARGGHESLHKTFLSKLFCFSYTICVYSFLSCSSLDMKGQNVLKAISLKSPSLSFNSSVYLFEFLIKEVMDVVRFFWRYIFHSMKYRSPGYKPEIMQVNLLTPALVSEEESNDSRDSFKFQEGRFKRSEPSHLIFFRLSFLSLSLSLSSMKS